MRPKTCDRIPLEASGITRGFVLYASGGRRYFMKTGVFTLILAASVAMLSSNVAAIVLNCPPVINIKAKDAPFPWTPSDSKAAQLQFSQASYSCSNGTCTLSCSYTTPNQSYTLLEYKVPPGTCNYTSEGTAFLCQSLPPPRSHRKHID
jgi:hypothetical protein